MTSSWRYPRSVNLAAIILLGVSSLSACGDGSGSITDPESPPANPPDGGGGGSGSVNNAPTIAGTPPASIEIGDNYSFQPEATDPDGDTLTFSIEAKPDWASFDSATGGLSGTPQVGDEGPYDDIVIEVSDGSATDSLDFAVAVTEPGGSGPANNPPNIAGTPPASIDVGVNYSFQPEASDLDGDTLTFSIQAKPSWASFDTGTGALSGTPQDGDEGPYEFISILVSDGSAFDSLDFDITVNEADGGGGGGSGSGNNAPTVSGTPPAAITVGENYSFQPAASDPDGDALTFSIEAKPSWASFNSASGALSGTPDAGDEGPYDGISIVASDGSATDSLDFAITVNPAGGGGSGSDNSAPTISGTPPAAITVGENYSFQPAASDPEGDDLTFSIQAKPSWASFDSATGALSGTPEGSDEDLYDDISIVVSDGSATDSLDFAITVNPVGGGGSANDAPTITGTPPASVKVGDNYSFQPAASDPDGDALTFSIQAKPSWASFNAATGALSGTPQAGDEGPYDDISIVVSDGSATDSLDFAVTVNQVALGSADISWAPPTRNSDGSTLTDLTAYKIYYGTTRGNYTEEIQIDNPGLTTYVLDNLSPDTYYFVATAINSKGVESDFSGVLVKVVD
ncbi:MAG: putative Ig domain-containing protein [Woeseia sp.]